MCAKASPPSARSGRRSSPDDTSRGRTHPVQSGHRDARRGAAAAAKSLTGGRGAMTRAIILTVDDDPAVSQAISRDLREQYASDYQIVRAHSGGEALTVL